MRGWTLFSKFAGEINGILGGPGIPQGWGGGAVWVGWGETHIGPNLLGSALTEDIGGADQMTQSWA